MAELTNTNIYGDLKVNGKVTTNDDLDVNGNIIVSGTVDGIDIATDVTANNAKITNATHTGDVTGDTVLTLSDTGVVAGSYTNTSLTVDSKGRITTASNGVFNTGYMVSTAEMSYKTQQVPGWENGGTTAAEVYTVDAGLQGTVNTGSSTGVFNTDHYECQGGAGAYSNSIVMHDTNTISIDSNNTSLYVYSKVDMPENTSIDIDINTITRSYNTVIPISSTVSAYSTQLSNGYLYFINGSDNNYIYRIKKDGTDLLKLSTVEADYDIAVTSNYVFFLDNISGKTYRVNIDGTGQTQIMSEYVQHMATDGTYIYYGNGADSTIGSLYKMALDGTGQTKLNDFEVYQIFPFGNFIYYVKGSSQNIYKIGKDGTGETQLNTDSSAYITTDGVYIFYANNNDNRFLYRINIDGTNRIKLNSEDSRYMTTDGTYVYYENYSDGMSLYRINIDGTNRIKLANVSSSFIVIDNEDIYFSQGGTGGHLQKFLYYLEVENSTIVNTLPNTVTDISTLEAGDLKLTFNLKTTDVNSTPTLKGWGVVKQ